MNEVATKVLHTFFEPVARRGFSLEQMVQGTSLTVEQLRSKDGRLDWDELITIHRNLRAVFTEDDLVETGRLLFQPLALRFMFVIGRMLLSPMGFYRWLNTPRQGGGNQLFTCVTPSFRETSPTTCEIELVLPEGFEICWDFFLLTKGSFIELPRVLGYGDADVRLERIARGARYYITIPSRTPLLTRTRQVVMWPFTARAAASALKAANESLVDRYEELETAQLSISRQRELLDTAYRFGQRVWGDRDASTTATSIVDALVEIGMYVGATVDGHRADAPGDKVFARAGRPVDAHAVIHCELPLRGKVHGTITVEYSGVSDEQGARQLLDLLVPTIALALDNAIAYRELADYQRGLENLVDERTVDLVKARDALTDTVTQLREAQSARQRFFANISHEIRTPLSLILLATDDIRARSAAALDGRARGSLDSVTDGARKLLRLVDELLLLAAGQEDKLKLRIEATDLANVFRHLVAQWTPAAETSGLELRSTLPDALWANVDPTAIERIASNLVSNAVKYTPVGGHVEIALRAGDAGIEIDVLDDGPGINDDLAMRLFGRFERDAGDSAKKMGTGLGLALVKQLVEAHGGTIDAQRRPTGGSEFHVTLPASRILLPGATHAKREESPSERLLRPSRARLEDYGVVTAKDVHSGTVLEARGVSRGTVLLAEDDVALANAISNLLADHYKVIVGLDGEAALGLVKQHEPQLLVTDVDMPKMNGIELAKHFRETTGDKLAPIIILSAVHDLGTRVAGLEAGAVDYVTKPFDPAELLARVAAQFRMRELAVKLHRAEQLSALGILTAGLAHELRNPANGIINALEPIHMLMPPELMKPGTAIPELLDVVGSCAKQISFLSDQLLVFRSGRRELDLQPVAARELVQRAVTLAQRALDGAETRLDIDDVNIYCAAPLMVQVLTNLIENAGHAAGRGGWVEIAAHANGATVSVEVADSGKGVPAELRERIFEPFFTTKAPGVGTGLGLPLARDIIHRHRGILDIRDRDGRTVFVVEVPRQPLSGRRTPV
jgi:signal transduction histidine kinase